MVKVELDSGLYQVKSPKQLFDLLDNDTNGSYWWNDVGSFDMMDILHEPDEDKNVFIGDVVGVDVKNSVIYSTSRTLTAVGVDNIVIVETPDAVMVCRKDKAQDAKKIVDELKNRGKKELL